MPGFFICREDPVEAPIIQVERFEAQPDDDFDTIRTHVEEVEEISVEKSQNESPPTKVSKPKEKGTFNQEINL